MRNPIVAANWKMNGSIKDVKEFAEDLNKITTDGEIIFSPPSPYLITADIDKRNFSLAAQTACEQANGAFTGEISMSMLSDLGCHYVIVGHSERRVIYGERNDSIFAKIKASFASGLVPILCIGETDEENKDGKTEEIIKQQLILAIQHLSHKEKQQIVIAYEPVWAIGSGRTPSIEEIEKIHARIRYIFSQNDDTISSAVRVLYGGSVNSANAADIFALTNVDGGLVGGASLKIDSFRKIIKAL